MKKRKFRADLGNGKYMNICCIEQCTKAHIIKVCELKFGKGKVKRVE